MARGADRKGESLHGKRETGPRRAIENRLVNGDQFHRIQHPNSVSAKRPTQFVEPSWILLTDVIEICAVRVNEFNCNALSRKRIDHLGNLVRLRLLTWKPRIRHIQPIRTCQTSTRDVRTTRERRSIFQPGAMGNGSLGPKISQCGNCIRTPKLCPHVATRCLAHCQALHRIIDQTN